MIIIACLSCSFALRTIGEESEVEHLVGERSEEWPNFICPACSKPAKGMRETEVDGTALALMSIVDLSPQEAFAAVNGLGLPREQQCSAELVRGLLQTQPVRRIAAQDVVGTTRCVVNFIELWDGTKLYFGASPSGAVIYRVAPPHSYVEAARG